MRKYLSLVLSAILFATCTNDTYNQGDGEYSYLTSDFAMLRTNSESKAVAFITDADRELTLERPVAINGLKADTTYRALVYYDDKGTNTTLLRNVNPVYVCIPQQTPLLTMQKQDPVIWNSIWISENGKYINLGLKLKVGAADDSQNSMHKLGIMLKKNSGDTTNNSKYSLTLYHSQNGVPEHYSSTAYLSIPIDRNLFLTGDVININIYTYDGLKTKSITIP